MAIVVAMDMNLAVKVLGFSPNEGRTHCDLNREGSAIAKAPLKNTAKQSINGVVLWITLKVFIKATMAFNREDGSEVELARFKRFFTTSVGTMGLGRKNGCKGTQQQSQKQNAGPEHETRRKIKKTRRGRTSTN